MSDADNAAMPGKNLPHSHRRRSGTETRQRGRHIDIRVTVAEFNAVSLAADRAGLSIASYARAQLLAQPKMRAVRRAPADSAALAAILAQLGKCGSNLNQIARALNGGGDADYPRIDAAIEEFCRVTALICAALGRPFGEEAA